MVKAGGRGRRGDRGARAAARRGRHDHRRRQPASKDTQRRFEELCRARNLRFLGVGVSGGEEGALHGPSIMPGGDEAAYAHVEEIFTKIAAQVDGTPCCSFVGPGGAGHYVKMVHNGIEYADMQLIAEAYDLLRSGVGLSVAGDRRRLQGVERGAARVVPDRDHGDRARQDRRRGDGPLLDVIVDEAEQKGTGRWTAQDALELGIPLTEHHRGGVRAHAVRASAPSAWRRPTASRARSRPATPTARPDRRHRAPRCTRQDRRLRPGVRADRRRLGGERVGRRPRRDGDPVARRLHHPRALPGPHPRGLRQGPAHAQPAAGRAVQAARSRTRRRRGGG